MDNYLKAPLLVIGGLASAIALFISGKKPKTTKDYIHLFLLTISGAFITNFLTPLVIKLYPVFENNEPSIGFIVGLLGIYVVVVVLNILKRLIENPIETIKSIRNIFKG